MTSRAGLQLASVVAQHMTEQTLQGYVCEALTALGYRWCHFRPARTQRGFRTPLSGNAGFPDIVAVRAPRLLFIELKSERGRLTVEQEAWIEALQDSAEERWTLTPIDLKVQMLPEVYVWRPSDWLAGTILELLR